MSGGRKGPPQRREGGRRKARRRGKEKKRGEVKRAAGRSSREADLRGRRMKGKCAKLSKKLQTDADVNFIGGIVSMENMRWIVIRVQKRDEEKYRNSNEVFQLTSAVADMSSVTCKFLNRYKNGSIILIISHSFFLRVLISIILKINLHDAFKIKINHLKIFQFIKKGRYVYSNLNRTEQHNILNQLHD